MSEISPQTKHRSKRSALPQKTAETVSVQARRNGMIWFSIFVLFCFGVYILRSVLMPFVAGIVLGYLLDPLARRFQKLGCQRTLATVFVFVVLILILVPACLLLGGVIDSQLTILINATPQYISGLIRKIEPFLTHLQNQFPELETDNLKVLLKNNVTANMQLGGKILKSLLTNGFAFINMLSLLLITPVVTFYMLRDWDTFVAKVDTLLPRRSQKSIRQIFTQIDRALSGFIRGQVSVCIILGAFYSLGLHFVGLDLGLLVGFLAGLISFIPYVGSISGFVVSMALAFAQFDDPARIFAVAVVFGIGQFLEGNFLTPKLVGENIGLHPVWVMFALLAGGVLLGFLGLMIAVPIAAILGVLIRHTIENYKTSPLYLDE